MATVRNLACIAFRPEALDVHALAQGPQENRWQDNEHNGVKSFLILVYIFKSEKSNDRTRNQQQDKAMLDE